MTERFGQQSDAIDDSVKIAQVRTSPLLTASPADQAESAKRRQIIEGARACSWRRASTPPAWARSRARPASPRARSTSTSKQGAAVRGDRRGGVPGAGRAGVRARLDDHDVAAMLLRLGTAFARFLCSRRRLAAAHRDRHRRAHAGARQAVLRVGPPIGIARLARYLEDQVAAGVLAIEDCEVAAAQFLEFLPVDHVQAGDVQCAGPPTEERIDHVVRRAVQTFLPPIGARGSGALLLAVHMSECCRRIALAGRSAMRHGLGKLGEIARAESFTSSAPSASASRSRRRAPTSGTMSSPAPPPRRWRPARPTLRCRSAIPRAPRPGRGWHRDWRPESVARWHESRARLRAPWTNVR